MPMKSKVAIIKTSPKSVLTDYQRLFDLAGGKKALRKDVTTIIKDNISWHYPMPAANTTPWQLEGTILASAKCWIFRPGLCPESDCNHQCIQR